MRLHIKSPGAAAGFYPLVTRGKEMKHLSFAVLQLDDSCRRHCLDSGGEELAIGFYSGAVRIEAEGEFGTWSAETPPRGPYRARWPWRHSARRR